MAKYRIIIEPTRNGNLRVRHQEPGGKRVSDFCVGKTESAVIDGKTLVGRYLAMALAKQRRTKYYQGETGSDNPNEPIEPLLALWLQENESDNKSRNTVNHHRNSIEPYIRDNNLKVVSDSTNAVMKAWKLKMVQEGLKNTTIRGRLGDVRTFHNWLLENEYLKANPFGKKMMPMKKRKEPQYYMPAEFKALDEAMATISHEARIGINLAHDCGLRKTEFVGDGLDRNGAAWEDITCFKEREPDLLIRAEVAKGGAQSGTVRLTPGVVNLLGSRRTGPLVTITRGQFDKFFAKARKLAGINPKLTVHGLRDTFAKNFLQWTGESLAALKEAMRHKDITSTMVYVQFERSHVGDAVVRSYERRLQEEALLGNAG